MWGGLGESGGDLSNQIEWLQDWHSQHSLLGLVAGRIKLHDYIAGGWSFIMSFTRMFDAVSLTVCRARMCNLLALVCMIYIPTQALITLTHAPADQIRFDYCKELGMLAKLAKHFSGRNVNILCIAPALGPLG